jgi:hypothetical protein
LLGVSVALVKHAATRRSAAASEQRVLKSANVAGMSKRMRGCEWAALLAAASSLWVVSAGAQEQQPAPAPVLSDDPPQVSPEEAQVAPEEPMLAPVEPAVAPAQAAVAPVQPLAAPVQPVAASASVGPVSAAAEEDSAPRQIPDTPAWRSNVGFVKTTGIAILFADGSTGVGLELSARYGIPAGPFILAPGARIGGYYIAERLLGVAMPTGRLTIPLGPLAPFVQGGAGIGGLTNPGNGGFAWLFGGGLMIHTNGPLSFGAEVNYSGVTSTGVEVLSVGPVIMFGG